MKVRFLGISWKLSNGIDLKEFFTFLEQTHDQEIEHAGFKRLLYVGGQDGYFTGLMITIKDHKRFCELTKSNDGFKLNIYELDNDSHPVDFNFFVINKETARGLYLYYHNSCSSNTFHSFLRSRFKKLKERNIAAKLPADLDPDDEIAVEKARRRAARDFVGNFTAEVMMRADSIDSMLDQLSGVRAFEFDLAGLAPNEEPLRSLQDVLKKVRYRISFKRKMTLAERLKGIKDSIATKAMGGGRVIGYDEDGVERVINLISNADSFDEVDFDSIADALNIAPEDFNDSEVIKKLLAVAKDHPAVFEQPIADDDDDSGDD